MDSRICSSLREALLIKTIQMKRYFGNIQKINVSFLFLCNYDKTSSYKIIIILNFFSEATILKTLKETFNR